MPRIWGIPDFRSNRVILLIQKPEQPQRDLIADACFYVVNCKKGVVNVFYLLKAFVFASDFKSIFIIDKKISPVGGMIPYAWLKACL